MYFQKSVWFTLAVCLITAALTGCSLQANGPQSGGSNPLLPNSIQSHRLGLIPASPENLQARMLMETRTSVSLPSSVDMSSNLPPVGDQGNQGSCSCWSTAYYNKTLLVGREKRWSLTSTAHQFSPSWVYNQINGGSDSGAQIGDAFQLMIDKGCDTLNYFPYNENNCTRQPDQASFQRAAAFCSSTWNSLPPDLTTIKTYLYQGHPLVFGIAVYSDFESISPGRPVYSTMNGSLEGYHALCVIGYDNAKKAVKFVNSWGSAWGAYKNDSDPGQGCGYGWIAYSLITNKNFYCEVNVLLDASNSSSFSSKSSASSSALSSKSSSSSSIARTALENLDNFPSSSGTYSDGSFKGTTAAIWYFTQCRGDIIISGKTPCLGKDRVTNAQLVSSAIPGGIKTLSFDYMQAFTTPVNFDITVNSVLVSNVKAASNEQNMVKHIGPLNIDTSGSFTIKFLQKAGGGQVGIDNIQWQSK